MSKVTVIFMIGLPGSGKTTLAKLAVATSPENSILLDDLSLDFAAGFARYNGEKTVYITDPWLCNVEPARMDARVLKGLNLHSDNVDFIRVYFANDPEACIINATRDPKPGGTINFIKSMTKKYVIPEGAIVYPVFKEFGYVPA